MSASTVIAGLIWLGIICALAAINPVLAFFPAIYLVRYLD